MCVCDGFQPLTVFWCSCRCSVSAEALWSGSGLQHHHKMSGRQQHHSDQLQLPVRENHGETLWWSLMFQELWKTAAPTFDLIKTSSLCAWVWQCLSLVCGCFSCWADIYKLLPVESDWGGRRRLSVSKWGKQKWFSKKLNNQKLKKEKQSFYRRFWGRWMFRKLVLFGKGNAPIYLSAHFVVVVEFLNLFFFCFRGHQSLSLCLSVCITLSGGPTLPARTISSNHKRR